jgi:hypothetical protein
MTMNKVARGRSYKHARSAGKGSRDRRDLKKYGKRHDEIFGKKKFNGRKFSVSYPPKPEEFECIMVTPPNTEILDLQQRIIEKCTGHLK